MRDFLLIMKEHGYFRDARWDKTNSVYSFETGSTIEFFSADQPEKLRGARRDRLFLNEANNIPFSAFEELEVRTKEFVYIDFNPVSEFWYNTEIVGKRSDYEFIVLTYKDNEALSEEIVKSIEQRKNRSGWWKVFGEGQLGEVEGRIYTGWQIISEIPFEARLEGYGLDFGYDPDPAALVAVYYHNGGYILDENLYERRLENPQLATTLLNLQKGLVIADSAEPKSIAEIRRLGVNIIGADKGSESVRYGVKTMQALKISVTSRSVNLIKEYRNFFQAIDRKTNLPIVGEYDGERHALDASRYKLCSLLPLRQRKEKMEQVIRFPDMPRSNLV